MTPYRGYINRLSRKIEARLNDMEAVFNFDLGSEFEVAMCLLLQDILPEKFGICRGFIVAENDDIVGDDLIIYDKLSFPTLRARGGHQYSVKEQVPAEAVYAYIECKHSIDNVARFDKAVSQARAAKRHLLTRPLHKNFEYEENGPVYNGTPRDWPRQYPAFKNQPFCAIFSRHFSGDIPTNVVKDQYTPDLLILGRDHIGTQSAVLGPDGIKSALFYDHRFASGLRVEAVQGSGFGLGLLTLMQALSWIELLPIDWSSSLNVAFASIIFGDE